MLELRSTLEGLAPDDVDALAIDPMAAGCCDRLRQLEDDRLWSVTYVVDEREGRLVSVLPLYTSRARAWSDSLMDPARWGLEPATPADVVLAGAPRFFHSSLRVARVEGDAVLADTLAAARKFAGPRAILLPHYAPDDVARLRALLPEATWAPSVPHCDITGLRDPDWESTLTSKRRRERHHDQRLIEAAGLRAQWSPWHDPDGAYARLFVEHQARLGTSDHEALVRRRYEQWDACPSVELLMLTAWRGENLLGVQSALRWRGELMMYEIALTGMPGDVRLATYALLISDAPVLFAQSEGLDTIRMGIMNQEPKLHRGAVATPRHYGVIAPSDREIT